MSSQPAPDELPSEYRIDIPELDQQHETFLSLLDRIDAAAPDLYRPLEEDEADALVDAMGELRECALLHFRTEEGLMTEADYPDLAAQEKAHHRFITHLERLEGDILNGLAIPAVQVRGYMEDWWRDHILTMDREFGEFHKKNKV